MRGIAALLGASCMSGTPAATMRAMNSSGSIVSEVAFTVSMNDAAEYCKAPPSHRLTESLLGRHGPGGEHQLHARQGSRPFMQAQVKWLLCTQAVAWCDDCKMHRTHQLREEVGGLRRHAAVHAEALDVLQIGRQLRRIGMDDHIDEHRQEVISPCSAVSLVT